MRKVKFDIITLKSYKLLKAINRRRCDYTFAFNFVSLLGIKIYLAKMYQN